MPDYTQARHTRRELVSSAMDGKLKSIHGAWIPAIHAGMTILDSVMMTSDKMELTEHAKESLQKRANIRLEWLEQAIVSPHRVEQDGIDPSLVHYLFRVDEFDGRVLRVVLNETSNRPALSPYFLIAN